ncbi:DUF6503 family protein [Acanthopleuribacter pedis]|uniref:Outer membrane lipoprotein-sorting protein n=1 Tax=Acanthopleuribacter pedis TaxID=442870 RepID=A0A8J7QBH1_9BACT|nr:DUF6503 family protein [Acanthopleuribacter pedis]MBO1322516.1 hypothetical protein [Acanthopleuribacter pedis]
MSRFIAMTLIALLSQPLFAFQDTDAKAWIDKVVARVGGMDGLHRLKDVQYTYIYQLPNGKQDVSIERYIFDGEASWAEYTKGDATMPETKGKVVQGYDGKTAWATIDGQLSSDEKVVKRADFLRKTNYYWFAMMHKLGDPGLQYKSKGTKTLEGIPYQLVEVGFENGVGDVQDTYLLYINPFTHLVDQFLFTVMDFDRKEPLLMRVDYETFEGVTLPTMRRYIPSNWEAEPQGDGWVLEVMQDITFNNGFKKTDFSKGGG